MLDIDLGTGEYPDESPELPALATMKQGFAGQKRGMKMKDRYLCVVLLVGQACLEASPGKDDDVADPQHRVPKFSAWLAGCKRCKTEGASDTGKLECASNWLGGQGSTTTGGEEALRKVTAIDSGVSPRLSRRSQEQGNE